MKKKSVEFFMVVTNRTIYIADYSIKSYKTAVNKLSIDYSVILRVFLNCIDKERYQSYLEKWGKINYVKLEYSLFNKTDFKEINGGYFNTKTNKTYLFPMLTCDESWDIGLRSSNSDYFVTVDDDFEIIQDEFVICMFDYLEKNKDIQIISVDKTIRHTYFDTYSKQTIDARERNDTWFCIYRNINDKTLSHRVVDYFTDKSGKKISYDFENEGSDWNNYILEVNKNNAIREVWDSAGWMQKTIREESESKEIICLHDINAEFQNAYIHYAAYSKNKSINTPLKTAVYRYLFIKKRIGLPILPTRLNTLVKKILNQIYKLTFIKATNERLVDNSKSSLD